MGFKTRHQQESKVFKTRQHLYRSIMMILTNAWGSSIFCQTQFINYPTNIPPPLSLASAAICIKYFFPIKTYFPPIKSANSETAFRKAFRPLTPGSNFGEHRLLLPPSIALPCSGLRGLVKTFSRATLWTPKAQPQNPRTEDDSFEGGV